MAGRSFTGSAIRPQGIASRTNLSSAACCGGELLPCLFATVGDFGDVGDVGDVVGLRCSSVVGFGLGSVVGLLRLGFGSTTRHWSSTGAGPPFAAPPASALDAAGAPLSKLRRSLQLPLLQLLLRPFSAALSLASASPSRSALAPKVFALSNAGRSFSGSAVCHGHGMAARSFSSAAFASSHRLRAPKNVAFSAAADAAAASSSAAVKLVGEPR
eukprot:scaffold110635_cov48-Phaeocystis_antarctica.AAC.2